MNGDVGKQCAEMIVIRCTWRMWICDGSLVGGGESRGTGSGLSQESIEVCSVQREHAIDMFVALVASCLQVQTEMG